MSSGESLKIESYESKRRQLHRSTNRFLYMFLIVFAGGYLFFFTSTLWLPSTYVGVDVTPIGRTVSAGDRNVTVDAWTYDSEQKVMEILIEVENNSIDGIDRYRWSVKTRSGTLPVTQIAEASDFVVLHADKVPSDWTEVSLNMEMYPRDRLKAKDFEPITIYVNDRMVAVSDQILKRSKTEYRRQAYQSKIDAFRKEIKKLQVKASEAKRSMDEADKKVAEIQEKMAYQTRSEMDESNQLIEELLTKKANLKDEKDGYEKEIQELQEKIKLQKQLLQDLPD